VRRIFASCAIAAGLFFSLSSSAQPGSNGQQPGPPPGGPSQGFKNLQILPKDIPQKQLFGIMRGFSGALGVHCNYCHEVDAQTHRPNFASDAKPEKATARVMMSMTQDINSKWISRISEQDKQQVNCGTCHRGHAKPEAWNPPPEHEEQHGGPPPAQ
jgi:hypothetical protein